MECENSESVAEGGPILFRHGRIYSGHPRLVGGATGKTWMAGTSPAMTVESVIVTATTA
jgi:hypothetical protein